MSFDNVIGNDKNKIFLNKIVSSNNTVHSYMFEGIEGIGKSIFARDFAKMLLCIGKNKTECGTCKSCIEFENNNNPDCIQIKPDGKVIKIEQIRQMQEKILEKPIVSDKKVYIIDDADLMTKEAQNCLLKTLEEPPRFVIIILVLSNESKILNTIKSRCMKIIFEKLKNEELNKYAIENFDKSQIKQSMIENSNRKHK
ncbi:MAG: AAA family ATPase [Clostridia bacterium]|nr:AAA family ATPase [Clostridia bacterium]